MEGNKFVHEVEKLINGDIKEIIVEKEDFLTFRNIWLASEKKNEIIGEAGLSGKVIYRYSPLAK